jgi:hypothetical protein
MRDNIKRHCNEIGWQGVKWIHLALDNARYQDLMNTAMEYGDSVESMEYDDHVTKYQFFKDAGPLYHLSRQLLISLVASLDFSHRFINFEDYCRLGCLKV